MRVHELGDPVDPPLVMLHGLASTPGCWARVAPILALTHRVLLVDLFAGANHRFRLDSAAVELATALDVRGVTHADVVGHSMGGLVALLLARGDPQRVRSLTLVDVPAVRLPRRGLGQIGAVARSSLRRDATAVGLVLGCLLRTNPLAVLAATWATTQAADGGQLQLAPDLPVLLVWGEQDAIVPLEVGQRLAASLPSSQLVVIGDAGHQPMWERPAYFTDALASFLARRPSSRPHAPGALR